MSAITAGAAGAVAASENSLLNDPGTQNYTHVLPNSTSRSGVRIATDRDVDERELDSYVDRADWLLSSGTASDYEVRCTVNSGTLAGGSSATGSYLALSSSREWYVETTHVTATASLTIDIRDASNTSDAISFSVSLSADGTPLLP